MLSGTQLAGTISPTLGNLTNLTLLDLQSNQLAGTIPTSLGALNNLTWLGLSGNSLSGSIPPSLGDMTNLESLVLNHNNLSGSIPSSLGALINLTFLTLDHNQLTGFIPAPLCEFQDRPRPGNDVDRSAINPQTGGVNLPCESDGDDGEGDRAVLVEFYNATDGPNWVNNTNWNSDVPLREWHGVTTGHERVIALNLQGNRLNGVIPPSLGDLTELSFLRLDDNQLSGAIPSSLGNLTKLSILSFWGNQLSGGIPSSLGNLTELSDLWLCENQLSGEIPSSLGGLENLSRLELCDNELTGGIPSSFERLRNLSILSLWNNPLMGEFPSVLGSLDNLTFLSLGHTQLTGKIPVILSNLKNLNSLDLQGNRLTGDIPTVLGELEKLEYLNLSSNYLNGEIPVTLGDLGNLSSFHLYGNQLTGTIPAQLCRFQDRINPQGEGRNQYDLPCADGGSRGISALEVVVGDGQLTLKWTSEAVDGKAFDSYSVRYRGAANSEAGDWIGFRDDLGRTARSATIGELRHGTVYEMQVRGNSGGVDGEWSDSIMGEPSEAVRGVTFGDARIEDQGYTQYVEADAVMLPVATGGEGVLGYELAPALPAGLVFDAVARTISGTPSVPTAAVMYTYTARDANGSAPSEASLTFTIAVDVSREDEALRRDALAAQGRALLSSVTGVIGERFRPRSRSGGTDGMAGAPGGLLEALGSMLGFGTGPRIGGGFGTGALAPRLAAGGRGPGGWRALGGAGTAGAVVWPGGVPGSRSGMGGLPSGVSAIGLGGHGALGGLGGGIGADDLALGGPYGQAGGALGLADTMGAMGPGSLGIGPGGLGSLAGGRSFAAALPGGGDGEGASRYTVWGAGDRQSFSGTPDYGRYTGDMRSLYVGADGRFAGDWLAGAALGRSWGASDYTASVAGAVPGRLTTGLTSVYPYVRGAVSGGLELWAIGGYGRGEARDVRGTEEAGEPGDLAMTMGAAGLRANVAEAGGVAVAVVGGAGSLSLSTDGGGLTLAGLAAGVQQARLGVELSRAAGGVSPYLQVGSRYDGGDGQTGAGLELVAGLRASTTRVDLEARGRWLSVHSAAGYGEYGAMARLAVKSRPDGTGLRASLSPRWGAPDGLAGGEDGLLGGGNLSAMHRGGAWTADAQALSLDSEVGYGWRPRRLSGILFPMTSYRRTGIGGDLTNVGLSFRPSEEATDRDLRMQFTLGRERWVAQGAHYRLAVAVVSTF